MKNANLVVKTLGRKGCTCASCGKYVSPFSTVLDYSEGGKKIYTCSECADIVPDGVAFKTTHKGTNKVAKGVKPHKIVVVATNPATVLDIKLKHGFTSSIQDNGDYKCEYPEKLNSCNVGGWLFNHDGKLNDEYQMLFIEGKPVETASEYHQLVGAQDWYQRVGE